MSATTVSSIEKCPLKLGPEHIASYQTNGFLAFSDFLTPEEVAALNNAMAEMVSTLYAKSKSGALPVKRGNWANMRNYSGLKIDDSNGKLSLLLEPDVAFDPQTSTLEQLDHSYRKIGYPTHGHAAFKALSEHPRLIGMLEALMGPAPILYGDMALCKPARIGAPKPWHQDAAYFDYLPFEAGVDVWIALDDAAVENGCMYVLPGGHAKGPKRHIHRDDCTVQEDRFDFSQGVPVEMNAGGILMFSVMLPHFTPPNYSAQRRRAVQFFYRASHTRLVSAEEHQRAFVEADGTPAACSSVKG